MMVLTEGCSAPCDVEEKTTRHVFTDSSFVHSGFIPDHDRVPAAADRHAGAALTQNGGLLWCADIYLFIFVIPAAGLLPALHSKGFTVNVIRLLISVALWVNKTQPVTWNVIELDYGFDFYF